MNPVLLLNQHSLQLALNFDVLAAVAFYLLLLALSYVQIAA